MDLARLLQLAFHRKWMVLGVAATTALLVFLLGRLLLQYEAEGALLVKPIGFQPPMPGAPRQAIAAEVIQPNIGIAYAPQMSLLANYGDNFTKILTSRTLIHKVVTQLELDKTYSQNGLPLALEVLKQPIRFLIHGQLPTREKMPLERAIEEITRGINAQFVFKTSIIQLSVTSETAPQAVKVANTLLDVFVEYSKDQNIQQAERTTQFLEDQLASTYAEVKKQQQQLAAIKETYGVPVFSGFGDELARLMNKLDILEDQHEKNALEKEIIEDKIARLDKERRNKPEYKAPATTSATTSPNSTLIDLQKKLIELRGNLQASLIDYAPNSPQVISLKDQIALLEEATEAELLATSASLAPLSRRIQQYHKRLTQIAEGAEQETQIRLAIASLEEQGKELQSTLDMIKLITTKGLSEVQILERPIIPRYPTIRGAPLLIYVIIGFFGGLGMGIIGVVWQDQWHDTIGKDTQQETQTVSL